jgi:hypothetical protein
MLRDIVPDHQQSKIRTEKDFQENFQKAVDIFIERQGFSVIPGYGPNENFVEEEETLQSLKEIWKSHHQTLE